MLEPAVAPWTVELTQSQYTLISYFLVLGGVVLLTALIRAWTTRGEVGSRYRSAVVARLGITAVATLSYVMLVIKHDIGYDLVDGVYVPNQEAFHAFATRYVDWSVTVPLLVVEVVAVCTLVGRRARRVRYIAGTTAFLMIFTGYLGGVVIGNGEDRVQLVVWGAVSSAFWIITTLILISVVRRSLPELTRKSALLLRRSAFLLLIGWAVYPAVYTIQIFAVGGEWTTVMQVGFTVTDIGVKVATGALIHRVAKLRTAEDIRTGVDLHPESIWISSIKRADAATAPPATIADVAAVNPPGLRPLANRVIPGVRYDGSEDDDD